MNRERERFEAIRTERERERFESLGHGIEQEMRKAEPIYKV